MSFILASDKGNPDKRVGNYVCIYCKKVFDNHRALGGHHRSHQDEIRSRKGWRYPGHSSTSIDITSTSPNTPVNCQSGSSSGGAGNTLSPLFNRATPPSDSPNPLFPIRSSHLNAAKFSETTVGNSKTQFIMSPNLLAGSASAEIPHSHSSSSAAFVASGVPAATGSPLNSSLRLGSNGVSQYNTSFRTWEGMPFSSTYGLQKFQYHNHGNVSVPALALTNPYLGHFSNQLPGLKASSPDSSLPPDLYQCFGQTKISQYNNSTVLTFEGGKKPHPGDVKGDADTTNTSKRPKTYPDSTMELDKPTKKELPLFRDVGTSFSELGFSFAVKEEGQADIDLSLHL